MTDALTLIEEGIEAFRLTREYVGEDLLPAIEGWSWFDWTEKARRALDRPDTSLVAATPPSPAPGLPLRCCDDPTPALHNGQPYCQACDRTLVPATAEQEAAWLARSLIPTDAATDEADQPGPFAQAEPAPVDEAGR